MKFEYILLDRFDLDYYIHRFVCLNTSIYTHTNASTEKYNFCLMVEKENIYYRIDILRQGWFTSILVYQLLKFSLKSFLLTMTEDQH